MVAATPRSLIFDCDGVLSDTEPYGHLPAFNRMFAEFGLPVHWTTDEYAKKLLIGGGKERLATLLTPEFVTAAGLPQSHVEQLREVARWHKRKTEIYTEFVASGMLPGRSGVARLVDEAIAAGWRLAVASTSSESAVRAVLEHVLGTRASKFVVVAGDMVRSKKPAPDVYLEALRLLHVTANQAVAIEDSHNGLSAAVSAGLRCVVTVSAFTAGEDFSAAELVVTSLGEPGVDDMTILHNHCAADPPGRITIKDLALLLGEDNGREKALPVAVRARDEERRHVSS
jgi:HAD superfamily hydrolase (TIGR01509 family)